MGMIPIVTLILVLVGVLPTWPHSRSWGYYPCGGFGLILDDHLILNGYGDYIMNTINKLDYDKVIEVAQKLGYDPKKPSELNKYINDISKMDLWDISKILFFGKKPICEKNKLDMYGGESYENNTAGCEGK